MNKAELIEALAQRSGLQKQKAKKLLEAYVDIVTEAMSHKDVYKRQPIHIII